MGIFGFLSDFINGPNPTRNWVERPDVPLEFDLDSCSLGGVPSGSRFEELKWLGPCNKRYNFKDGRRVFVWFFKGLDIEVDGGTFHYWKMSFGLPGEDRYQPFSGVFILAGRKFHIAPASPEAKVIELMGPPTRRVVFEYADEDEHKDRIETLLYRIGAYEYQFDFLWEGTLAEMTCVKAELEEIKP